MPLLRRRSLVQFAALSAAYGLPGLALADVEAWQQQLPARLQAAQVPGLSWALIDAGELLRLGAWGFADLAAARPMRADTLLMTASVTKTFTAALLMQAVERGQLALDDAAERHLPFALRHPSQAAITLRQLLTHSSSLADDAPAYDASYACGDPRTPLADWLRERLHGAGVTPPFHPEAPGQRHAYSNVGYGLLGLVIERLAGQPFPEQLQQALLAPLGMRRSHMLLAGQDMSLQATPYEFVPAGQSLRIAPALKTGDALAHGEGQQQPLCAYSFATLSDGLLRSSAEELARYALALLQPESAVLRAASRAQMFSEQLTEMPAAARPKNYVQGLAWRGLGDGVWAHFGRDPGAAAALALRPRDGRAIVMLANSARARGLMASLVSAWMQA